jgi:hypothetical protein
MIRAATFALLLAMLPSGGSTAQGLRFEGDSEYAAFPRLERYRAFLPLRVDLSARFPTPGDQGKNGSSAAWAVGYAARGYYAIALERRRRDSAADLPSPAFLQRAVKPAGGCAGAITIPEALGVLQRSGAPSLAEFPSPREGCPQPLAAAPVKTGFRIVGWKTLDPTRLDDLKGSLAGGHPVIVGLLVPDEFRRLRGDAVWNGGGRDGEPHALVLVGYDETRQAFKAMNSWGSAWANSGFGWIGYPAFARQVRRAYVMEVRAGTGTRAFGSGQAPISEPRATDQTASDPLESYRCSALERVGSGSGQVIRGFVGRADDLARLKASARSSGAQVEAVLRPWPQCEILLTLREALAAPGAPALRLRGDGTEYRAGEPLVIELTAPDRPSYLYLAYVQASGEVAYLAQPRGLAATPTAPKQRLVFGDGGHGRSRYTVTAPFGEEMILALAADSPLFDEPRPPVETEREFLTMLRRVLLERPSADAERRKLAAAWTVLRTRER